MLQTCFLPIITAISWLQFISKLTCHHLCWISLICCYPEWCIVGLNCKMLHYILQNNTLGDKSYLLSTYVILRAINPRTDQFSIIQMFPHIIYWSFYKIFLLRILLNHLAWIFPKVKIFPEFSGYILVLMKGDVLWKRVYQ